MKFIAGLRVWGNWEIGENVLKVFLRLRGSANRRVDLFLPLIASIPRGRRRDIEGLAMPEAGTQISSTHSGSGGSKCQATGRDGGTGRCRRTLAGCASGRGRGR